MRFEEGLDRGGWSGAGVIVVQCVALMLSLFPAVFASDCFSSAPRVIHPSDTIAHRTKSNKVPRNDKHCVIAKPRNKKYRIDYVQRLRSLDSANDLGLFRTRRSSEQSSQGSKPAMVSSAAASQRCVPKPPSGKSKIVSSADSGSSRGYVSSIF